MPTDDHNPPAGPGVRQVVRMMPRTVDATRDTATLRTLLQDMLDRVDRGEVVGIAIVAELTGNNVSSGYMFNDVHRMLGVLDRLRHRLLTEP